MKFNFRFFFVLPILIALTGCQNTQKEKTNEDIYSLKYPYYLPSLGYAYSSLEPHIDSKTMEIHYTKHHKAYIDKLNDALKNKFEYQKLTLRELIENIDSLEPELKEKIENEGGGHLNHSLFWTFMSPNGGGKPEGQLLSDIETTFGSFDKFKEKFNTEAKKVFGSGWAWLVKDNENNLKVLSTSNQDNPISLGYEPILGLDVWEHAYYLKYQNKRPDYISAWWNVVDWLNVQKNYDRINNSK